MSNEISVDNICNAACMPHWDACNAACQPHRDACNAACAPYWKAYNAVVDAMRKALEESQDFKKSCDAWNELVNKTNRQSEKRRRRSQSHDR